MGELLLVQLGDVDDLQGVFGIILLNGLSEQRDALFGDSGVFGTQSGQLHGKDPKREGFVGFCALHQGQGAGEKSVENSVVSAEQYVYHVIPPLIEFMMCRQRISRRKDDSLFALLSLLSCVVLFFLFDVLDDLDVG